MDSSQSQPEQVEQPVQSEQPDQPEQVEQPVQTGQPEPAKQPELPEQTEQTDQTEQPDQLEQPEPGKQPELAEQLELPEHTAQTEQPDQLEQPEPEKQPELADQPELPDQTEQFEQPDQLEQPEPEKQPEPAEQPELPDQTEQFEQPDQLEQPEPEKQPELAEQPELPEHTEQTEQPGQLEQPEPEAPPGQPQRGDILQGTIQASDSEGLWVNLELSRLGLAPVHDLEKLSVGRREKLTPGEAVSVYIIDSAAENKHLVVSIHQAVMNEKWLAAEQLLESGEIWEGKVVGYNQGGLIVPFGKLRGFVPISQLRDIPRRTGPAQIRERLGNYVGQTLPLRAIEVDRRRRRLVFSHRKAYREWRERQRASFLASLHEGEVRTGRVRDLQNFGAFVDLGGGDGLIHISELAWHRVNHPKEILRVGQEVQVYILKVNQKRKRVGLSLKRLSPHPWSTIEERFKENQLIEGRITRVTNFGAFVELEPGIEGLLHSKHLPRMADKDPHKVVTEDETHLLRILSIDAKRRRVRLSMRAVSQEEQLDWMAHKAELAAQEFKDDTIGLDELIEEEE